MTLKQIMLSSSYAVGQITVGLLLHPYQTVQSLAQKNVFGWMVFLPCLVFVLAKIIWLWIIVPVVQVIFSCSSSVFFGCDLIPFLANWLLLFCIYWQVILLYLFGRFWLAFSE